MSDRRERINDPEETFRIGFEGLQAGMWTAMPGIIETVKSNKLCDVQPTIQGQQRDKNGVLTNVNMPLLLDCLIYFPSGGGFTLTFPIAKGDECLVVFANRCIDSWWQSGGVQPPAEFRMHDLSDGFAFVGFRSSPKELSNVSTTSTQLRSNDGATFVEVGSGKIQLIADEVIIHGRNKTTFDAGGTGFVYTPSLINNYTNGVTSTNNAPNPPIVPT